MSVSGFTPLSERLARQSALLDATFGAGGYRIDSDDAHRATLRSDGIEWRAGVDERDGALGTHLIARGDCWEEEAGPWLWALFLAEEPRPFPRDGSGRVTVPLDDQLGSELELLARLRGEIFCKPSSAREAASFVRCYTRAYNDWASGKF